MMAEINIILRGVEFMKKMMLVVVLTAILCSSIYGVVMASCENCQQQPAVRSIYLQWPRVEQAVAYEVELVDAAQVQTGQTPDAVKPFWHADNIYTQGCNVQLPENFSGREFYWRVRGLNLQRQPQNRYTVWQQENIDSKTVAEVQKPLPTARGGRHNGTTLLYPVYAWLPLQGVRNYEVEILDALPENPNTDQPSKHRIASLPATGFDLYDDTARIADGKLYWRVIGKNDQDETVGVYSDAVPFGAAPSKNYKVAVLGDSITHGGGSISYSPSDWEYSYLYYLDFNVLNVGCSGDTSATTLARFDQDVLPFHPEYLLIMTGSNSLRADVPAEDVIADLEAIKQKCLDNEITPVFLTLPPINPDNIWKAFKEETTADWQAKFVRVNEYIQQQTYVDSAAGMADEEGILPTRLALDGLHLDPPGKVMMAAAINRAWPDILRQTKSRNTNEQ